LLLLLAANNPVHALTTDELVDGFKKTVFGSEYSSLVSRSAYVRKFSGAVRFHVIAPSTSSRGRQVKRFVRRLPRLISGLKVELVDRPDLANFRVYVVPRRDYLRTIRRKVYRNPNAVVRGRCMVRSVFNRSGIRRSDAVIVADEGASLFRRCMTEEILQGLGPLNDDRSLKSSMFNDTTGFTRMTRFDRIILNMLYDPRLETGSTLAQVEKLLPRLAKRAQRRVR